VSSIPTSLIIVLLVAAWLVVLVPMFARRREAVPESDDDATGFRVLRRERKARKRAAKAGQLNQDRYDMDVTTADSDDFADADAEQFADEYADSNAEHELEPALTAPARPTAADDAADDWAAEQARSVHRPARREARDEHYDDPRHDDVRHDDVRHDDVRPIPSRKGRGGFDPDAAERTRMFRYRRRRRVLLLLVALLLGSIAVGYLVTPMAWFGTAAIGLLLVGFLVYLRRQVRIEAEIRARRMAKLRRARQVRPEPRRENEPVRSPYRADPQTDATGPTEAMPAGSTVPPAAYRSGRVVVDLDDDDPAFEDLEQYHSPVYRRQAG
jgi:hypothetical protein